jgi:hypothetical protein
MIVIDPAIAQMWKFVSGAMALQIDTYRQFEGAPLANRMALYIVLLAGFSEAIAQGTVLFINRVKPFRFALSIGIAAVLFVFGFLFWASSTWLATVIIFRTSESFGTLVRTLSLSFAPRLLSVFIALPYLGTPISFLLSVWSLLCFLVGLRAVLGITLWQAFACGILGWLVLQILERTIGRPFSALGRWIRNSAAGVPLVTNLRELERLVEQGRQP